MRLGVDVGGTFTDAALHDGSRLWTAKVPTTPSDQSLGVLAAVDAVLERAGASASQVEAFAHGMTVGTNALLEGRGARTALVTTEGFADVVDIARQNRPSLYRPCEARPAPLVAPGLRFEVRERVSHGGVVEPLTEAEAERIAETVGMSDAESVAVCLLFSFADPSHESSLAERLRAASPSLHVSVSSEVLPRFREFERFSTTIIDAYLSPLLRTYLGRLAEAAAGRGLPAPLVMRSSGGVADVAEASSGGAWSVLSGPAGGAVGAGLLARLSAGGNAIGLDMGGTSCDVCVVEDGEVRRTDGREIAGHVLQLPMVDVHTVGAGGGSVGWRDRGGVLRVGPRSAGAEPGPACYGRGGSEPTVTDADLALGRLPAEGSLAGGVSLDADAAREALERLGSQLGLDPVATAEGIVRIANQEMVRALRVVTVERGVDPRGFALMPFGGAGPLHAAEIAGELGMNRIACPRASGVLSALGLLASERRRDTARTVMLSGSAFTADAVAAETGRLGEIAAREMPGADLTASYALRYRGQAFELNVTGPLDADPAELVESFERLHAERYGYRETDAATELVDILVSATVPGPDPGLSAARGETKQTTRRVHVGGAWVDAAVVRGEPEPGFAMTGPAVFELPEATLLVPGGWRAGVDATGTILMERET